MPRALAALSLALTLIAAGAQAAQAPETSLNGGYVYTVEGGGGAQRIVQTKLADRSRRVVIDGEMVKVIRTGRYAGYLMVKRHTRTRQGGLVDAIWVVRPDVREVFIVPGTDNPDAQARNAASRAWRSAHHATFDSDH